MLLLLVLLGSAHCCIALVHCCVALAHYSLSLAHCLYSLLIVSGSLVQVQSCPDMQAELIREEAANKEQ